MVDWLSANLPKRKYMAHPTRQEEIKQIDALGRINLGKEHAHETYSMIREKDGTLILTPVAMIPKRELWLWKNKEALTAVREGLEQSARGEREYLGTFSQYSDEDVD
jgi:hypothetical protein